MENKNNKAETSQSTIKPEVVVSSDIKTQSPEKIIEGMTINKEINIVELMPIIMDEAVKFEIRDKDKNEKGELLVSPEGKVSNLGKQSELWWKIVRTKSFKIFFGDWQQKDKLSSSKIIDENGEPLVLFRGLSKRKDISLSDFYNKEFYKKNLMNLYGVGVYFTPDEKLASTYAKLNDNNTENDGTMVAAFANIRKPKHDENLFVENFIEKGISLYHLLVPRAVIKNFPKINVAQYDGIYGWHHNRYSKNLIKIEELHEIVLKDPNQVLIIPMPIKKIENSVSNNY